MGFTTNQSIIALNNYLSICAQTHKFSVSWLFSLINPLIVLSFLVAAHKKGRNFTSQFFRITSYCFLNHRHPVLVGERLKINTRKHNETATLFIYWKDFKEFIIFVLFWQRKQISRLNECDSVLVQELANRLNVTQKQQKKNLSH